MIASPDASSPVWLRLAPYAAPAAVLLAIVLPFLRFYEYDLLLPESLILIGSSIAIGVAVGALSRLRPQTLGPALMAIVLYFYFFCRREVTDGFIAAAKATAEITGYAAIVLAIFGLFFFLLDWAICARMRRHLDAVVLAVFGTIVLTTLVLPVDKAGEPIEAGSLPADLKPLPPLIHIILDEHIGLAGLPPDIEESDMARQVIPAVYKDFALYSHAYSRFDETKYSLASLMNRDLGADVAKVLQPGDYTNVLNENDWFSILKERGYAIKVYQSAWLDVCSKAAVDACYTYSLFSPNAIQRAPLTTSQRLRALLRRIVIGSGILQMEPMVSQEALLRMRSDIAGAPRGVAYFVHLLIPHHGYLYGSDCSLRDPGDWKSYEGVHGGYTHERRAALYPVYLDQLVCADRQVGALIAELKTLGVYDEATIIVHGDHGSRLAGQPFVTDALGALTPRDNIDNFATLLAIKAPGVAAGIHVEPVALQHVFAQTFLGGARENGPQQDDIFVRTDHDGNLAAIKFAWPDAPAPDAGQTIASEKGLPLRKGSL